MGRIVALDVGRKRTGIAATDRLQIVPNGIGYMPTGKVADWLVQYCKDEPVELLVVGEPKQSDYTDSESRRYIDALVNRIKKLLPDLPITWYDERYTSVMAHQTLIQAGLKKSKRREKGLVDQISAVLILRDYLESRDFNS